MQQQMLAVVEKPASSLPFSFIQHRRNVRFHITYDDFMDIADGDEANADAIRYFEWKTSQRIAELCRSYGIPDDHLPADDDLWLDASLRDIESQTLSAQSKSTYARCLLPHHSDGAPRSLIELGFIKRRFIARPGFDAEQPATTVCRDDKGDYIILTDEAGNYVGNDGKQHNAMEEGFTQIYRQFLCCIEAINAAIAVFDGLQPPKAIPRWRSMLNGEKGAAQKKTTTCCDAAHALREESKTPQTQGNNNNSNLKSGTLISPGNFITNHDEIVAETAEIPAHRDRSALFRNAALCAETIIGLSSAFLVVPDRDDVDEEIWYSEWQKPAERLFAKLHALDATLAWERIDWVTRYMETPGSPSWWQSPGRTKKTPITLKHVANNFEVQFSDLRRKHWQPSQTTPYDGPADTVEFTEAPEPIDYAAGLRPAASPAATTVVEAGVTPLDTMPPDDETTLPAALSLPPEPAALPEVVAPAEPPPSRNTKGLDEVGLRRLDERIRTEHPSLSIGYREIGDYDGYYICLEYAPEAWLDIGCYADWYDPTPDQRFYIDLALGYGASLVADPPGRYDPPAQSVVVDAVVEAVNGPPGFE